MFFWRNNSNRTKISRIEELKFLDSKVVAEENFNRCIKLSDGNIQQCIVQMTYMMKVGSKQVCFLEKNMKAEYFSEDGLIDTDNRIISNMNNLLKVNDILIILLMKF